MKITNLDLLCKRSDYLGSIKLKSFEKSYNDWLVKIDYSYIDNTGEDGLMVLNGSIENIEDYLSKVVEIPILNLEPVMKQVKFQSGFVVLEGYCFAATCFNYKVKVGETIYYPKEVTIC